MISSKTLKIAGAAILGTFVGTGPAYAQFYVDGDDLMGGVNIANETMGIRGTVTVEGTTYYRVRGNTSMYPQTPIGVNVAAGESIVVSYDLTNMVFIADAKLDDGDVTALDGDRTSLTGTAPSVRLVAGGQNGDTNARFTVTAAADNALAATEYLQLHVDEVGMLASSEGGSSGSFTATVSYEAAGQTFSRPPQMIMDPIKTKVLVTETVTTASPMTTIDSEFKSFAGGDDTSASVGSLRISIASPDTGRVSRGLRTGATDGYLGGISLAGPGVPKLIESGTVEFEGDVSFVDNVTIDSNSACGTSGATSLVEDNDAGDGKVWKQGADLLSVTEFASVMYICVHVDESTVIPNTSAYTATVSYEGLTNAAFPPPTEVVMLGRIQREGTSVYIPYLTTSQMYNQRLVLRNRGSQAIGYSLSFAAEEGITAEGTSQATGSLGSGTTMMRVRDLVTLEGGARTAATLTLEAGSASVDVATVLVNPSDGSTDTVTYTATASGTN